MELLAPIELSILTHDVEYPFCYGAAGFDAHGCGSILRAMAVGNESLCGYQSF